MSKLKQVIPRVTWWEDLETLEVEVTLDNTPVDYRFAFKVSKSEAVRDREVFLKRVRKVADILLADYHREFGA